MKGERQLHSLRVKGKKCIKTTCQVYAFFSDDKNLMLGEGWKLGVGVGFCVHIRKQILTLKRFIVPQSGLFLDIVNINIFVLIHVCFKF